MAEVETVEQGERVLKSTCRGCHGCCGVLVHLRNGTVTKVEGDPDNPMNRGTLCSIGLAAPELLYHEDRLLHPMKRVGPKGSGQWERISWDEAYGAIAEKLLDLRAESGPESVCLVQGTGRDYAEFLYRFSNVFGTPNVATPGYLCYFPRVVVHNAVCGGLPIANYQERPKCAIIWGCNPHITSPEEYQGAHLVDAMSSMDLIVLDPRFTTLAAKAKIWLQLRPGTDTALALGMINHIIANDLHDREFVETYTTGFEELAEHVRQWPLDAVEQITGVPSAKIAAAAELYASAKPAAINPGQVLDGSINCVSNALCMAHLMALTGNIDRKGGDVLFAPPKVKPLSQFALHGELAQEQHAKRLGGSEFPVADRGMITTHPKLLDSILDGKPYRTRAVLIHGSNALLSWPDSNRVHKALTALEFLVVTELFMTPTAELADIVLPAATWLETDDVAGYWTRHGNVSVRQKVTQVGEAKSDQEILNELGRHMGYGDKFFDTMDDALTDMLTPSGMTWEKFKEVGFLAGEMKFEKYRERGFSTPSRTYEFVPKKLQDLGLNPLPAYLEPPESPVSQPKLAEEYPLILSTGIRQPVFFHSESRQITSLRAKWPEPLMEIHPDSAARYNLEDGGMAIIESPRGRITMKVKVTPGILPGMVAAPHAWWFPEKRDPEHGWRDANINVLTDSGPPYDAGAGSVSIRTLLCRVRPAH